MDQAQRDAALLLNLTPGLGPILTRRCLDHFGTPRAALDGPWQSWAQIDGVGQAKAQAIRRSIDELQAGPGLAREQEAIAARGATVLFIGETNYPKLLALISDPPPLLYVRGRLIDADALALAVVGSRKCTQYGREQTARLAGQAAQAGLTIVSGGAYGIDAAAHRAALRAGGRTVAVLGSGLAQPYPTEHVELFDEIVAAGSAVVSELPMNVAPRPENFPRRNRIISGLALGVLVVEAALRSGALITARLAAEDHGRQVMAVPGRVDSAASAGCLKIIREGWAALVASAADVLDELGEAGQLLKVSLPGPADADASVPSGGSGGGGLFYQNLSDSQRRLVDALAEPLDLDQLASRTTLAMPAIQADLTILQVRGLVGRSEGRFRRLRGGE